MGVTLTRSVRESGVVILALSGDLDTYGTRQINDAFAVAVSADRTLHIVIDLAEVSYISSAAIAMLVVHAQSMTRAGGQLYIANATEQVSHVFEVAGFHSIVPVFPTLEDALAAIEPTAGDTDSP